MKQFRWQLLIVLLTALIVGVILILYQNKPESPVIETPSPISGGSYTEALVGQFSRLNPLLDHYNQVDRDVDRLLFSRLIRHNSVGLPVPELAQNWTVSDDATHYTFYINEKAVWHDGVPVTSHDVAFTVSLLQSGSPYIAQNLRDFWPNVEVIVHGDDAIEFVLQDSFAAFFDYLNFQILPSHLIIVQSVEELIDHPFTLSPVGSGPFRFSELIIKESQIIGVELVANDFYFEGRPFLDKVTFRYYFDRESALQAYLGGEVDGLSSISTNEMNRVLAQPGLNLYSSREAQLSTIFLNNNSTEAPYLSDADFRKALMAAINRQGMIDEVLYGQGILAVGPFIPDSWAFFDGQPQFRYDPDLARQLIAGLGMKIDGAMKLRDAEGQAVKLQLLVPNDLRYEALASIVERNWKTIGIEVVLDIRPYEEVLSLLEARNYQAALIDVDFSATPDPDPYPFWSEATATEGQNYSGWVNATASEYIEQARVISDYDLRTRLYRNFQVLFAEDLPSLPLFYTVYNYAVKDTIQNVSVGPIYDPSDRFNTICEWYIKTGIPGTEQ